MQARNASPGAMGCVCAPLGYCGQSFPLSQLKSPGRRWSISPRALLPNRIRTRCLTSHICIHTPAIGSSASCFHGAPPGNRTPVQIVVESFYPIHILSSRHRRSFAFMRDMPGRWRQQGGCDWWDGISGGWTGPWCPPAFRGASAPVWMVTALFSIHTRNRS